MNNDLIIGYGEVGQALHEIITDADWYDWDGPMPPENQYDRLHIAYPWADDFQETVDEYVKRYRPKLTIVYSTVPIGTCEWLAVVHSPVEGKHPNLADGILRMTRWIGSSDLYARQRAESFWAKQGVDVMTVSSADYTEFLKLRSTARYGINIAFANYEARVAEGIQMPYELVKEFDEDYNELYAGTFAQRYILDDPHGRIGGHCVAPNAEMLSWDHPSPMLKEIIRMGGS